MIADLKSGCDCGSVKEKYIENVDSVGTTTNNNLLLVGNENTDEELDQLHQLHELREQDIQDLQEAGIMRLVEVGDENEAILEYDSEVIEKEIESTIEQETTEGNPDLEHDYNDAQEVEVFDDYEQEEDEEDDEEDEADEDDEDDDEAYDAH